MTIQEKQTEEKIFDAAREVFIEKGFDGARMEDISQKAGINKALLHYYFRTKEKLFNVIFEFVMGDFFSQVSDMMSSDETFFKKIEFFVGAYLDVISKNPHIPNFIINELNRNPQRLITVFENTPVVKGHAFDNFAKVIRREVEKGTIEAIEPDQLIVNIIGLCVFPIIAKPILQGVIFRNDKKKYAEFLDSRKTEVSKFIINSIRKK
jgi:TetR/AcrR family transcriptional regulator